MKRISLIIAPGMVILIFLYYLLTTLGPIRHLVGALARRTAAEVVSALNLDTSAISIAGPSRANPINLTSFTYGGTTNDGGIGTFQPPFSGAGALNTPRSPTTNPGQIYLPYVTNPYTFLETFDGMPPSPQPWNPSSWDVTVHSRDVSTFYQLELMNADHGPDCAPPPATHPVSSYEDAVFICHDHMMTAINTAGYGVIYLTPNQLVDFSNSEAIVRFDLSTLRRSDRDWVDLWITPFQDNLQLPLGLDFPDLDGPPRNAVHFRMDFGTDAFKIEVISNFTATEIPGDYRGYDSFLTPSATRRDTFELHISSNHLKFGMPAYNFWWVDTDIPDLGWTQGIVQFGHHSYNPTKSCNNDGTCGPNTWHWDNVFIRPAIPFTIIRANERHVDPTTAPDVTLPAPAPQNAYLRFAGVGTNIEVSFDSGLTWQPAPTQTQYEYISDHFWSYWMPIPAGISKLQIRGQNWYGGPWMVRDISVWSLQPPAPTK